MDARTEIKSLYERRDSLRLRIYTMIREGRDPVKEIEEREEIDKKLDELLLTKPKT